MKQRRLAAPGEAFSFTETVKGVTGAAEDLSAATLVAKSYAPDGTVAALTASGTAAGALTISGTLAKQAGEHQIAASVNGAVRVRRSISAQPGPLDT